jgi:hypothetical protein
MKDAFSKIARRLSYKLQTAGARAVAPDKASRAEMLDQYVTRFPNPQSAVDLFEGTWWSAFPPEFAGLKAGQTPHFQDSRIKWAIEAFGGVGGRKILELGPMEGGHTYMLEKAGAESVVAIEASSRAYMKCLVTKEVTGLKRSSFLLGDFEEYLRGPAQHYDAVLACGVLYHLKNPVELIHNLARFTDQVYLWTQYYVRERIEAIVHQQARFREHHAAEYQGFRYTAHRYEYGDFLETTRFAGGSDEYCHWLERDDLLGAFRHAGFTDIQVGEDDLAHVNGPCISLVARKPNR